jgi:hypothetical protein
MTLQDNLLKSLLDLVVAVAWACWRHVRESGAERSQRAAEEEGPVSRLETRRAIRGKSRPVMPSHADVVAVLVSTSAMEERVRRALDARARLCFTRTWAELQEVARRVSPSGIVADPAADTAGDPVQHVARFSAEWRIPVVLYAALTPRTAETLLRLGKLGVRHLIWYRYDDAPERFVGAFDWGNPPSLAS